MTDFDRIGVVGAGMMGSEIALMFALSGRPTLLSDQSRDAAERAIERLHGVLDRGLPRGFWSEEAAETARRHLSVAESLEGHADRDFVIEAVFEDEELKRDVFKRLDAILAPEAGSRPTPRPFQSRRLAPQSSMRAGGGSSARISFRPCLVCGSSKSSRRSTPIPPLSTPSLRR